MAALVGRAVARGEADAGIVIDGAGIGSAIAANKIAGVRAVMATSETIARYSREHNGANVLTLGATLVSADEARAIVATWLSTPMREPRYIRRLAKIRDLEASRTRMTTDELQRLIDVIVQELVAAPPRAPSGLCRCHAVVDDCCPDRLRGVLDAGATRVGVHASGGAPAPSPSMIDHTLLKPDATRAAHRGAVPRGGAIPFRDGLRQPDLGRALRRLLAGSGVGVCSVVGFPLGRDHRRRQGLRNPPGDLRRRPRNRHGDQRRRAQVGRSAHGRARHRSGHRAVPRAGRRAR